MKKSITFFCIVFLSLPVIAQWHIVPGAPSWCQRISSVGNNLYIGANSGVYKSVDGAVWDLLDPIDANVSSAYWNIIEAGNDWYLASTTQGAYKSSDQGQTWVKDTAGTGHQEIKNMHYDGNRVFIVTAEWASTNLYYKDVVTNTWVKPDSIEGEDNWGPLFYQVMDYNSKHYATSNRGLYESTDNGISWLKVTGAPGHGSRLTAHNGNLFMGCFLNATPLHKFDGTTWTPISLPSPNANQFGEKPEVSVLYSDGNNLYSAQNAGLDTSFIYMTNDDGASWVSIADTNLKGGLTSMVTFNGSLYGVTKASGTGPKSSKCVKFDGNIASIDKYGVNLVQSVLYPNPFSTNASLVVENRELQNATLHIYDLSGKVVQTYAGLQGNTIEVNRDRIPSGLYIYQLSEKSSLLSIGKFIVSDD